jgi:ribosome-binding protein aMBF1 (putative translation factor)
MINKNNFNALVSTNTTETTKNSTQRIENRDMLRESQGIAIKILKKLDENKWTQKDLAQRMGVTPQQVSKIVSGKENLTIETQIKLQKLLDIPILASYYERGASTCKSPDQLDSDMEFDLMIV